MNEYKQAAEQNLKVWARRLNVSSDKLPSMAKALHKSFPGSVLKGPLAIVISAHLMGNGVPSLEERRPMALAICHVLADHLRGEGTGNFRKELELVSPTPVFKKHGQYMIEVINFALAQRRAEQDRPSLSNMIINHVRGRG